MDASGNFHSVAAMLEGRIACVCDLEDELVESQRFLDRGDCAQGRHDNINVVQVDSAHQSVVLYNASFERDVTRRVPGERIRSAEGSYLSEERPETSCIHRTAGRPTLAMAQDGETSEETVGMDTRSHLRLQIPRAASPLTMYTAIGNAADPPRSLALCPTRHACIAFGCIEGVQLHWLEARNSTEERSRSPTLQARRALQQTFQQRRQSYNTTNPHTRRHLIKWFPLSAPSDCLRFVPNNPGDQDSPERRHRLRLISSVDVPQQPACLASHKTNPA